MKATQNFLRWCSGEVSELKHADSKKSRIIHGRVLERGCTFYFCSEGISLPTPVANHGNIQETLYCTIYLQHSALEVIDQTEIKKKTYNDLLPSEEKREKEVESMCESQALRILMKQ